jgi:hypothetical protein
MCYRLSTAPDDYASSLGCPEPAEVVPLLTRSRQKGLVTSAHIEHVIMTLRFAIDTLGGVGYFAIYFCAVV